MQRGKRDRFTDQEFFDACNRLSLMVGQNNITVLLAKVYAEQLIASKDVASNISALPENIPNLMLGYINELNRDVTDYRFDDRTVHQDAKAIAWECLQQSYQPATAKRADAIAALAGLGIDDPEAHLDYLEKRLHLIQTIGSAKDRICFCLDPLAEYLAGWYLIELYGNNDGKWRSHFFKKADDLFSQNRQTRCHQRLVVGGARLLLEVQGSKETDFVPQKLGKLAGFTPSVTPVSTVQTVIP